MPNENVMGGVSEGVEREEGVAVHASPDARNGARTLRPLRLIEDRSIAEMLSDGERILGLRVIVYESGELGTIRDHFGGAVDVEIDGHKAMPYGAKEVAPITLTRHKADVARVGYAWPMRDGRQASWALGRDGLIHFAEVSKDLDIRVLTPNDVPITDLEPLDEHGRIVLGKTGDGRLVVGPRVHDGIPPSTCVVSSLGIVPGPIHDRVRVWNRGGLAGELVVTAGDGVTIADRLSPTMVRELGEELMRLSTDIDATAARLEEAMRINDRERLPIVVRDVMAALCDLSSVAGRAARRVGELPR